MKSVRIIITGAVLFAITLGCLPGGSQSYTERINAYRDSVDRVFADERRSILPEEEIDDFDGLNYFEVDTAYRFPMVFERNEGEPFEMMTTTNRIVKYKRYGYAHFTMGSDSFQLALYQNTENTAPEYSDYLFCPFTDSTNGRETYGGGRYLDFRTGDLENGYLDFNLCYNPYCAYNYKYSCPIPPKENRLSVAIPAGVKNGYKKK